MLRPELLQNCRYQLAELLCEAASSRVYRSLPAYITSRLLLNPESEDVGADAFMLGYQKAQNLLMNNNAADP